MEKTATVLLVITIINVFYMSFIVVYLNKNAVSWAPQPKFISGLRDFVTTFRRPRIVSSDTVGTISSSTGISDIGQTPIAGVTGELDGNNNRSMESFNNDVISPTTQPRQRLDLSLTHSAGSMTDTPFPVGTKTGIHEDILQKLDKNRSYGYNYVEQTKQISPTINIGEISSVDLPVRETPTPHNQSVPDWPMDIKKCYSYKDNCIMTGTGKKTVPCARPLNPGLYACSHLMSVRRKPAKSGNQMFQVASLLGTAFRHGYTPVIPPNFSIREIFDLPNVMVIDQERNEIFTEKGGLMFTPAINRLSHDKNWTLTGFLQSWKYFVGAEKFVRHAFKLKENHTSAANTFLNGVSKQGLLNVCIHIRHFSRTNKNKVYFMPSQDFINRAVTFFQQRFGNATFIVLSKDKKWVKKHINIKGSHLSPFVDAAKDMALMASCDHMILTSGTFGWWGAWLSGGTVVYWRKFVEGRSKFQKDFATSYYPSHWISME